MENLKTYLSGLSNFAFTVHITAALFFALFVFIFMAIALPGLFATIVMGLLLGGCAFAVGFVVYAIVDDVRDEP